MKKTNLTPVLILTVFIAVVLLAFRKGNDPFENTATSTEMIFVTGGTFLMGQKDGEFDEKPVHEVTLSNFYIGKYEVTVSEYQKFCKATKRSMPKEPEWGWQEDHPIINTSWNDAMAFIEWLNSETGETYRLPTEAEFEYVIREGGKPGTFSWGDGQPTENIADISYSKVYKSRGYWEGYDDGFAYTAPVGSFQPNTLGVYDINGNMWEWVSDWHAEFTKEKVTDPRGPATGTNKVGKGGSYNSDPWHSRTASRAFVEPDFKRPTFRLAKSID